MIDPPSASGFDGQLKGPTGRGVANAVRVGVPTTRVAVGVPGPVVGGGVPLVGGSEVGVPPLGGLPGPLGSEALPQTETQRFAWQVQ